MLWARRTVSRWETGAGSSKRQPQHPSERPLQEALIEVVTSLVPDSPGERGTGSFREVFEAFAAERLKRQDRGGTEQAYVARERTARERNEKRHQFLDTWPSPAGLIDPLTLGLGSWAFAGALPPYVPRSVDKDLVLRLNAPGVTTVSGAPKSGKSRSVLEVLQRGHPDALTWWVNPSPTVLPKVVDAGKKAKGAERPVFIVLDDVGLIGTDPGRGLTAQRLHDLTAACTHLIVVIHDEVLAGWEHQLTHRTRDGFEASGLGVTRELMNLLGHRIGYNSVLDDVETAPAAQAYEGADERVRTFDLTRLAETLAGVEMLLAAANKALEAPTSVEAALLEAAIDATIAFPAGTTPEILAVLASAHYRRRQPNRPWRPHLLDDAFDTLTTGITAGSPHAILTTTDHATYRLLDALTPELQHPNRNTLDTLTNSQLPDQALNNALLNTGIWLYNNGRPDQTHQAWTYSAEAGYAGAMFMLGLLAYWAEGDEDARGWWERAAENGEAGAMCSLGNLAFEESDPESADVWWERAADHGHAGAMCNLGTVAYEAGDLATAKTWYERAAESGDSRPMTDFGRPADQPGAHVWRGSAAGAMFNLGRLAAMSGDLTTARTWYERAAGAGHTGAVYNLGHLAAEAGDLTTARIWYERAAESGNTDAMYNVGTLADEAGDPTTARTWYERAANSGNSSAMNNLGRIAAMAGDSEAAGDWWKRAAGNGDAMAMYNLGTLAGKGGDLTAACVWWKRAAGNGDAKAASILGILAEDGYVEAMDAMAELAESRGDDVEAQGWRV